MNSNPFTSLDQGDCMKNQDLFFVKLSTFLCYCPLFNPNDRDVLLYIINENYKGGVNFRRLEKLSGLSKTTLVRSLNTLLLSKVVLLQKLTAEKYPRYALNTDRSTYTLPVSTIDIINEQERILGFTQTFIPGGFENAEHAYSFLERNLPGYAHIKKDPFIKAYKRKEEVAQEYLQELRERNPRLSTEKENNFEKRVRI